MKKITTFLLSLFILTTLGAGIALAQTGPGGQSPTGPSGPGGESPTGQAVLPFKLDNPFKYDNLFDLLVAIIQNILMPVGGIIAVLAFIYSGFLFVSAQGNETKLKTAKQALLYTAVGTAVLLGSWAIANVIKNTINQIAS